MPSVEKGSPTTYFVFIGAVTEMPVNLSKSRVSSDTAMLKDALPLSFPFDIPR